MSLQVLIVGGGVSGLRIGSLLSEHDLSFKILESRERTGGRVLTEKADEENYFDLGPTWFWPDNEQNISDLIGELDLATVPQYNVGDSLFESSQSKEAIHISSSEMNSRSLRLAGGIQTLVKALKEKVNSENIMTSTKVTSVEHDGGDVVVNAYSSESDTAESYRADVVVCTIPPRLLLENVAFTPALPDALEADLLGKPTWMGAQAKIIVTYDRPFWRDAGLSGNAISWAGPLKEIYDATTENGKAALSSFFSLHPVVRAEMSEEAIRNDVIIQLKKLFGEEAGNYDRIFYKDWSLDEHTATDGDKQNIESFPAYGPPPEWKKNILFAGTEYSSISGGHLEGAIASAHDIYFQLKKFYGLK